MKSVVAGRSVLSMHSNVQVDAGLIRLDKITVSYLIKLPLVFIIIRSTLGK